MLALSLVLMSSLAFAQDPADATQTATPVVQPALAVPAADPQPQRASDLAQSSQDAVSAAADQAEKSLSSAKQALDASKDASKLRGQEADVAKAQVASATLKLKATQDLLKARKIAGPVEADAPERNDVSAAEHALAIAKYKLKVATLAYSVSKVDVTHAKAYVAEQQAIRDQLAAGAAQPPPDSDDLLKLAAASAKAQGKEAKAASKLAGAQAKLATLQANPVR